MSRRSEYAANCELKASLRPAKPYIPAKKIGFKLATAFKILTAIVAVVAALQFGGVL